MEKNRIILFFVIALAILYGSRLLLPPPPAPKTPPVVEAPTPEGPPGQKQPGKSATGSGSPSESGGGAATEEPIADIHGESAPEIVVDNPLYTAKLSNTGAVLKSFTVKGYPDSKGNPVEMVHGWPLTIDSGDKSRDETLAKAIFQVKRDGSRVTFEWAKDGTRAWKEFQFNPDTYTFSVSSKVSQGRTEIPHRIAWTGFGDSEVSSTGIFCWLGIASCDETSRQAVVDTAGSEGTPPSPPKFTNVQPEGPKEKTDTRGPALEKTVRRAGMQDQFFLLMFNLEQPGVFHVSKNVVPGDEHGPTNSIGISAPVDQGPVRLYVGPKRPADLEKAEPGLGGIVNYGMFWFLTEPLAKALMWIHGYVGNFGWSIILLTLAINFALFPLRLKQQLSMQKMQKIQPQMRTLQDKLKKLKPGDPRRNEIQAQMMNVYKEHGVNPVGGCFPLLLQLPFLYAFLTVLQTTIELRRAPWILWIQDLSAQDPYFIMPILMAGSMVVMQKMSPTTMDPQQARMMMIMPVMMVALFLSSPSGLMLYWLTGNLIGMGQQFFINKYWSPADAAAGKDKGRSEART
jgi:YidC/Oxa1 family membrane protein insertase